MKICGEAEDKATCDYEEGMRLFVGEGRLSKEKKKM